MSDDHRQTVNLNQYPALVLNGDYSPMSLFPLSVWPAEQVIKQVWEGNVDVLAHYDVTVRSPSHEFKLPSVIALREYVPPPKKVPMTRFNVFLRDGFRCQYCGEKFTTNELTFEHVIPRAQGGKTTWDNILSACNPCNLVKANRTPKQAGMTTLSHPHEPSVFQLREMQKKFPPKYMHETWKDYVSFAYWNTELEP